MKCVSGGICACAAKRSFVNLSTGVGHEDQTYSGLHSELHQSQLSSSTPNSFYGLYLLHTGPTLRNQKNSLKYCPRVGSAPSIRMSLHPVALRSFTGTKGLTQTLKYKLRPYPLLNQTLWYADWILRGSVSLSATNPDFWLQDWQYASMIDDVSMIHQKTFPPL